MTKIYCDICKRRTNIKVYTNSIKLTEYFEYNRFYFREMIKLNICIKCSNSILKVSNEKIEELKNNIILLINNFII